MNKSWVERLLGRPYFIYSFLTLFLFLGVLGYNKIDRKLFPDSQYPEIAVVIVQPGGSAKTIASTIAVPVEEELYSLGEIRRVHSSTIDEVSVIRAEFEYSKDLDLAASDVATAIGKIRSSLPADILEPQIHKISSATAPVLVIALSPAEEAMPLEDVRQLAENEIRQRLIQLPGVANVDVFGGYRKEVQIRLDKEKLDRHGLSLGQVLALLQANDRDYAIGFITNDSSRYLLKLPGRADRIAALKAIRLTPDVSLGDVSEIHFGFGENLAAYFGNGKAAIAPAFGRCWWCCSRYPWCMRPRSP